MNDLKKNYISGKNMTDRLPDCSFAEHFIPLLKSHPKGNVIQVDALTGYEETSEELLKKSIQASEGYSKFGFSQNDTFCLLANNSSPVYSALLGVCWLGGTLAPIDPDWNIYELQGCFKKIKPTAIICEERVSEKVETALRNIGIQAKMIVLAEKNLIKEHYISFNEILETHVDVESYVPKPVDSPSSRILLILMTSGTTGTSKGVGITHKNLIFAGMRIRAFHFWSTCKSYLVLSHFFWITCFFNLIISLYYGTKRIYMADINAKNALNAIHKYKPQSGLINPAFLGEILNHPDVDKHDLSSFEVLLVGGSVLTQSLVDTAKKIWKDPLPLVNAYGATEVTGVLTITEIGGNILCAGKPDYNVQIKIVDPRTGKTLGANEEGELYVQSPGLMKEYVNDEEETRATLVDGWCRTGDLGYYDEEENVYIIGRLKEMIKHKGRQITPSEIEDVIESMPGVKEAGVAGIERDSGQADLIGFVVKTMESEITEDAIKKKINDNLAEYKQLKEVVFVEKIPRTSTGKIRRKKLKEMVISSHF